MKTVKRLILIIVLGLLLNPFFSVVNAENEINIYFFHSEYCGHCQLMDEYFQDLVLEYDNINIVYYELSDEQNPAHNEFTMLFEQVKDAFDLQQAFPTVIIGGISFVGFNEQVTIDIEHTIDRYSDHDFTDVVAKIINDDDLLITDFDSLERDFVSLPLIGEIRLESLSLFLAAVVLGFVDGFNPCAMWVLIFLISLLINMQNRKRMWIIGVTFLATSALVYFLIMVSWLQVAVTLTSVNWMRSLIGLVAIVFGGYNVYKFMKTRKQEVGCEVTDDKQRSKLMERMKRIVTKQNLFLALLGVAALAITVNLIELACSAGLPLLFTQILAYNDLNSFEYFFYILIYIFLFLIDDLIIFTIAMVSFNVSGISNKYSRISMIAGGIIMLIIGFLLIFYPNIIMFNF